MSFTPISQKPPQRKCFFLCLVLDSLPGISKATRVCGLLQISPSGAGGELICLRNEDWSQVFSIHAALFLPQVYSDFTRHERDCKTKEVLQAYVISAAPGSWTLFSTWSSLQEQQTLLLWHLLSVLLLYCIFPPFGHSFYSLAWGFIHSISTVN